jgi:hypothetical protein
VSSPQRETTANRLAGLHMVPVSERDRRVLMISTAHNAFFDESGTHDASEIIALGGLISTYDGWSRWELEWSKILKAYGIKVFHFSTFMARKGEFDNNWTDAKRNEFMERLCVTIADNITLGVACSVFKDNYEKVVPVDLRQQFKHPYFFCVYTCVALLLVTEPTTPRLTLPKPIQFLFDRKPGYEGFAAELFYKVLGEFEKRGLASGFRDMGFGSKEKDIPLQAADLFIGVTARNFLRSRRKNLPLSETVEKSLKALGSQLLVSNAGVAELEKFVRIFQPANKS